MLYILSSFKLAASQVMLCTLDALIIHVHNVKHCLSIMTIVQKLVIPIKVKEKKTGNESSCSWFLVKKRRGEDDKSKSIDDGQVSLPTPAHDQIV